MLPENKIQITKAYQAKGHIVVMVGDGVNDALVLAQADMTLLQVRQARMTPLKRHIYSPYSRGSGSCARFVEDCSANHADWQDEPDIYLHPQSCGIIIGSLWHLLACAHHGAIPI